MHLRRKKPVLFVGGAGTGKTQVIKDYLSHTKTELVSHKTINFSSFTDSLSSFFYPVRLLIKSVSIFVRSVICLNTLFVAIAIFSFAFSTYQSKYEIMVNSSIVMTGNTVCINKNSTSQEEYENRGILLIVFPSYANEVKTGIIARVTLPGMALWSTKKDE